MKKYYTYYSYEKWGRGYIGSKPSGYAGNPEEDPYLGSFRDKTFNPTEKIILGVYATPGEALKAEIKLHEFFKVDINPHFANLARQTSTGFISLVKTEEHCRKISKAHMGKKLSAESVQKRQQNRIYASGEDHPYHGKRHNSQTRDKIKEARAKQTNIPGKGVDWWEYEDGSLKRCEPCPGEGWVLRKERTKLRRENTPREPNRRYVNEQGVTKRSRKHPGEGWQNGCVWKEP